MEIIKEFVQIMPNTAEIQYFRKQFLYEKKLESVEIIMVIE